MQQDIERRFRIGFTGSRKGMTADQRAALAEKLRELNDAHREEDLEAHHGDAVGADEQFHTICQDVGIHVIIHPSKDRKDRAFCEGTVAVRPPLEFRKQSESIVRSCDILIAAPDGFREQLRGSGTWMTVRIARKAEKTVVLCYPDGDCKT